MLEISTDAATFSGEKFNIAEITIVLIAIGAQESRIKALWHSMPYQPNKYLSRNIKIPIAIGKNTNFASNAMPVNLKSILKLLIDETSNPITIMPKADSVTFIEVMNSFKKFGKSKPKKVYIHPKKKACNNGSFRTRSMLCFVELIERAPT